MQRSCTEILTNRMDLFPRLLFVPYMFFVFFPYVKIFNLNTDTQPYALITALPIFTLFLNYPRKLKLPAEIIVLAVPLLAAIMLFGVSSRDFGALRSLANYMSLFFITSSSYLYLRLYGISQRALKLTIWVWFIVGVIQLVYDRQFLTFLISADRTSSVRGVTSLAVEPTYYATMSIFFLFLAYLHLRKNRRLYIGLLLIQIFVLAASFTIALLLVLTALVYVIIHINNLRALSIALMAGTVASAIFLLMTKEASFDSRIVHLTNTLIHDPTAIFLVDVSGNKRFFSVVLPIYGFLTNYAMPHGVGAGAALSSLAGDFGHYVLKSNFGDRIMSYYGQGLFELGILGLVIPISVNVSLYKAFRHNFRGFISSSVLVNLLLLSAIPIALPIVSFLIAYVNYWVRYQNPDRLRCAGGQCSIVRR